MAILVDNLNGMIEVAARMCHRKRPNCLTDNYQQQSKDQLQFQASNCSRPPKIALGENEMRQYTLSDGRAVSDIISPTI
jgi:hypothetical protein